MLDTQGLGSGVAALNCGFLVWGSCIISAMCRLLADADAGLTRQCITRHQFISLDHHGMGVV